MKTVHLISLADGCIAQLMEHCDAVQILMTGTDGRGESWSLDRGSGNWYARQGLAHEFIDKNIAQENAHQIGMVLDEQE